MESVSRGSSSNTVNRNRLPMCFCGTTMRSYISGSAVNPGRPYWKCLNWMKEESCKLFVWDDEINDQHFTKTHKDSVVVSSAEIQNCITCKYSQKLIEDAAKEKEKLKGKLAKEREMVKGLRSRIQFLQMLLIFSWVVVVYTVLSKCH